MCRGVCAGVRLLHHCLRSPHVLHIEFVFFLRSLKNAHRRFIHSRIARIFILKLKALCEKKRQITWIEHELCFVNDMTNNVCALLARTFNNCKKLFLWYARFDGLPYRQNVGQREMPTSAGLFSLSTAREKKKPPKKKHFNFSANIFSVIWFFSTFWICELSALVWFTAFKALLKVKILIKHTHESFFVQNESF